MLFIPTPRFKKSKGVVIPYAFFRRPIHSSCSFRKNYRLLKDICPQNQTLFIIKANAYGHGMKGIATFAYKELGINEFGLATLKEGLALREYLKGEFETYIFSDLQLTDPS